jgi:lipopolysaccharide transport system permease protein
MIRKVAVYTPESSLRRPVRMIGATTADLVRSRDLALRLAIRDISAMYRQTFLGIAWAFLLPLSTAATWIFLNGTGIVSVDQPTLPYAAYVFSGTMLWAVFTDALLAPLRQVTAAKGMLTRVNFPREALIVSGLYQALFNGGIKVAVMLPVLLLLGVYPGWSLALLPLGLLALVLAGSAVGLMLTPVGLLYEDIEKGIPLLTQLYMYATPVVFPMPEAGRVATLFQLNPLTPLVLSARDWATGQALGVSWPFLYVFFGAAVLFLVACVMYRAAMTILIERLSA